MNITRNRLVVGALVAVAAVTSVAFATISNATVFNGRDCSTNSIIKCGTLTPSELRTKYNASSELKSLYGYFGMTSSMINGKLYDGTVGRDGNIVVGGKVVATNAESVGRLKDNGGAGHTGTAFTVAGKTYYRGPTSSRFGSEWTAQTAFVMLDSQGRFLGAIIKGCGNPAPAKPTPKPAYECKEITKRQISRAEYEFNVVTTVSGGAKNNNYRYDFGDGSSKTVTSGAVRHTYSQPGTYTVTVTPTFIVDGKVVSKTSAACKTTVTVAQPPVEKVKACNTETGKIEEVEKGKENTPPYTTDLSKCQPKPPVKNPGVDINKTVNGVEKDTVEVGEEFTYELAVKNTGDVDLKNVKVTDPAPAGVTMLRADKGEVANNQWSYTIPELKIDQTMNFTITATVKVYVEGSIKNTACVDAPEVTGNPDDCDDATVEVPKPPVPPKEIQVCRLEDKQIVTINEKDFDAAKYSKDLSDCKETPVTPVTPEQPTPQPPVELPTTGAGETVVSLVGLGSLIAAASYYVASRRALNG